jgi:hypothetical protein
MIKLYGNRCNLGLLWYGNIAVYFLVVNVKKRYHKISDVIEDTVGID